MRSVRVSSPYGLATLAVAEHEPQRALRLWGVAAGLRESIGAPLTPIEMGSLTRDRERALESVGNGVAARIESGGERLSMDESIALAIGQ